MLDGETLLTNKNSMLLEIAPKIIAYAYPKKRTTLDVKSLIATYEELIVGLENTSIEYQSKTVHNHKRIVKTLIEILSFTRSNHMNSSFFSSAIQQLIAIRLLPHVMPNPKKKLSKSEVERLFCPYLEVVIVLNYIVSPLHNYSLKKTFHRRPISG